MIKSEEEMTMSSQSTVTVVLANRPRLFRELLQHALNTASSRFRVIEATDALPSASTTRNALLHEADWLVVDEEAAAEAGKLTMTNPKLKILSLDGRGSRARVLATANTSGDQGLNDVPTLARLFELLSQEAFLPEETQQPR
jgi:hypothetical protein